MQGRPPRDTALERVIYDKPGYLIRRLQQLAVSVFLEETARYDTTPIQYGALAAIRAHPGIDQLRLSHAIGLDRTTIAGVVERLEQKALIRRTTGVADRRTKLLEITPAGARLLEQMVPHTDRAQERMLEGLTARERKLFLKLLKRLVSTNNAVSRISVSEPTTVPSSGRASTPSRSARS